MLIDSILLAPCKSVLATVKVAFSVKLSVSVPSPRSLLQQKLAI
jgi:hypothetical protein